MMRHGKNWREPGFALIFVLWILMVGGLLAAAFAQQAKTSARDLQSRQVILDLHWRSHAAIALAVSRITEAKALGTPPPGHIACRFGDAILSAKIEDEHGKIDLNEVSPQAVSALLIAMGRDTADAQRLATSLADYIDADGFGRSDGTETRAYAELGLPAPRNGKLISILDLVSVAGWQNISLTALSRHATVHSGRQKVDPARASEIVRKALVDLGARQEHRQASAGSVFTIRIEAESAEAASVFREAVIGVRPETSIGYDVLEWQTGNMSASRPLTGVVVDRCV